MSKIMLACSVVLLPASLTQAQFNQYGVSTGTIVSSTPVPMNVQTFHNGFRQNGISQPIVTGPLVSAPLVSAFNGQSVCSNCGRPAVSSVSTAFGGHVGSGNSFPGAGNWQMNSYSSPIQSQTIQTQPVHSWPVQSGPVHPTSRSLIQHPTTNAQSQNVVQKSVNRIVQPAWSNSVPAVQTTRGGSHEQQLLQLVNAERTRRGLSSLTMDSSLLNGSRSHSAVQSSRRSMHHASNLQGARAENVAMGNMSPQRVMQMWMNSPGHRRNILNPSFKTFGGARSGSYWTQRFR